MSPRQLPAALVLLFLLGTGSLGCISLNYNLLNPPDSSKPKPQPTITVQDVEIQMPCGAKFHARWYPHPNARGTMLINSDEDGKGEFPKVVWEMLELSILIIDTPCYGISMGRPKEESRVLAELSAWEWIQKVQQNPR